MPGQALFVYGTLLSAELAGRLLGRAPASQPAELHRYRLFRLPGRAYPAIRYSRHGRVTGRLYTGLTPAQLRKLDRYEGTEYRRQRVNVCLREGKQPAWVYVARSLAPSA